MPRSRKEADTQRQNLSSQKIIGFEWQCRQHFFTHKDCKILFPWKLDMMHVRYILCINLFCATDLGDGIAFSSSRTGFNSCIWMLAKVEPKKFLLWEPAVLKLFGVSTFGKRTKKILCQWLKMYLNWPSKFEKLVLSSDSCEFESRLKPSSFENLLQKVKSHWYNASK